MAEWSWETKYLERPDAKIRYSICRPSQQAAKQVIYLANGRTEWIEKYNRIPERLNLGPDYEFVLWDHRGQGASSGKRGDIRSYDQFNDDMAALVAETAKGRPYSVVAHSMGALISLTTTLRGLIKPRMLVLSSPLFLIPETTMKRHYARKISFLCSRTFLGAKCVSPKESEIAFENNQLTHSQANYKIILNSPYKVPSPTFNWVYATFQATDLIMDPKLLEQLSCPVHLLSGTEETVVDRNGFELWREKARQHAKVEIDHQIIAGGRHELLFESDPYLAKAVDKIRNWLVQRQDNTL
ncbi:MAG: alpha/beta fold hydrolase [Oligoflexales bacterium]